MINKLDESKNHLYDYKSNLYTSDNANINANDGHNVFNVQQRLRHTGRSLLTVFITFITYFILFVIIIPYYLLKNGLYEILEFYLPNLDLVANLLTYRNTYFESLYNPSPISLGEFLSQSAVNYLALLGITYIIARETLLSNNIAFGWSAGFMMLLLTYLLPSQFINRSMDLIYNKANKLFNKGNNAIDVELINYITSIIGGIILTIGIIYLEHIIIQYGRTTLKNTAQTIINIPKLLR